MVPGAGLIKCPWLRMTTDVFFLCSEVRSFGTEDRPTDRPAPPREEIYEYIIFRGSDIKDITVCEPPKAQHALPQDPAIVQVSVGHAVQGVLESRWNLLSCVARVLNFSKGFLMKSY